MSARRKPLTIVCTIDQFKVGDPPPTGYLDWFEWASVQSRAGIRQERRRCGRWHFTNEPPCRGHA
jgi:hypothetical protein